MTEESFEMKVSGSLARIEQKIDDLAAPNGRVARLEEDVKRADTRQWVHSSILLPLTYAIYRAAKYLGGGH